jgi:sigma-B regulation protein RsbU (phosphoserine phosphatase)
MQIANSGLPRPIYCHEGVCEIIDAAGLPCGLFEDASYDEINITASAGDVFVFLTDGILDARDEKGELFSRYRLEEIVAQNSHRTADEIVDAIFGAVLQHSTGQDPFDDQTVVAVKILPGGELDRAQSINPAEV